MKRLYVMDCGDFVKIGVSENPDERKSQIPYKVNQYYCTEPLKNAFTLESQIHHKLNYCRVDSANGREYFHISFKEAVDIVKGEEKEHPEEITLGKLIDILSKLSKNELEEVYNYTLSFSDPEKQKPVKSCEDTFRRLPDYAKTFVLGIMKGVLLERAYIQNKQIDINKLLAL